MSVILLLIHFKTKYGIYKQMINFQEKQLGVWRQVPICLNSSIIPVSKEKHSEFPNDYRPVALTPIFTKCLERLILKADIPADLDQHQFAYRVNISTEDAVITPLHTALKHLDQGNIYVRMLFGF